MKFIKTYTLVKTIKHKKTIYRTVTTIKEAMKIIEDEIYALSYVNTTPRELGIGYGLMIREKTLYE